MGVNVGQELPSSSSTHSPKAAQGCSLFLPRACVSSRTGTCADESQGRSSTVMKNCWRESSASVWLTGGAAVLPRTCILMGTSPRRHHLLWDHFQLPMDLCAAARNKAQPTRLKIRFACWSLLHGLGREPQARQPSPAPLCITFRVELFICMTNIGSCLEHVNMLTTFMSQL